MSNDETTYIRPHYRRTRADHKPIDGVQFYSYSVGILRYARIIEDGQIMTLGASARLNSYRGYVIGHGVIRGSGGKEKRFQSQDAAAREAIKIWRKLQAEKVQA